MAHLQEITSYKNQLMQAICTNENIFNLLKIEGDDALTMRDMPYERVFPYAHVPDTNEEAKAFVCFDLIVPRVWSNVIKEVEIDLFVMSHQAIMRMPDGQGIRIDLIATELDKMLNGSRAYGVSTVDLTYLGNFIPINGYYGHEIRYKVPDINRSLCEVRTH